MATGQGVGVAQVGEVVAALLLVLLAVVAVAWLLRRVNGAGVRSGLAMRVLAAMPLGQRERLLLVEIGGAQLLLGVSAAGISRLHHFDPPLELGQAAAEAANPGGEFALRLRQALRGAPNS